MDDSLWEDDLADLEVNLLIFEDLDFLDPPPNAYILKDVDCNVNDIWLSRTLVPFHFIHKNNYEVT